MGPRLDDDLWSPSPLGCVGPGELASLAGEVDVLYRPLLELHRLPVEAADLDGSVEVVVGDEAWDRLAAEPDVLVHTAGRPTGLRDVPDADVVVVRGPRGLSLRAVLAVRPDRYEPRVAEVVMAWYPSGLEPEDPDRLIARGWLALFGAAAERGVVGITADVTRLGSRQVRALTRLAGLRPVAEAYAAVGLGAPDASIVLDRWHATVAADGAVAVRLERHDADPEARAELAGRLVRLLARRDDGDEPSAPGIEVRLTGTVELDGCRRWGGEAGSDDDPDAGHDGEGDVDLPAATRAADRCLVRWAAEHA